MRATIAKPDFGELDLSNRGGFINGFLTLDRVAADSSLRCTNALFVGQSLVVEITYLVQPSSDPG